MAELAEGAPLLREYGVDSSIEGSNPSLSARKKKRAPCGPISFFCGDGRIWFEFFVRIRPTGMWEVSRSAGRESDPMHMARIVPDNPFAFPPSMEVRCASAVKTMDGRERPLGNCSCVALPSYVRVGRLSARNKKSRSVTGFFYLMFFPSAG